jgi:hypothetical protein
VTYYYGGGGGAGGAGSSGTDGTYPMDITSAGICQALTTDPDRGTAGNEATNGKVVVLWT